MRSEYLDPTLYTELYSVMERDNVNAMRVALETGLRIDDVLSLKPEQLQGARLRYTAKKTGKSGTAKLSASLRKELLRRSSAEWVFPSPRGKGKHRTRQAVYKDVKKACSLLGVEGQISPHSARKTFAVELRKTSGVGEVQKALQHSDKGTTLLYAFADVAQGCNGREMERADNAEYIAEVVVRKIEQLFEKRGIFPQICVENNKKTED